MRLLHASNAFGTFGRKLAGFCIILLFGIPLISGCEKFELDRQMEELCKKDGGVRVYETVKLPPEMFEPLGDPFPGWRKRKPEDRLGADYLYEETDTVLKDGDPLKGQGRLVRYEGRVIRRADGKLLGTYVIYGRSGGDFIAFPHFTSNSCPVRQSSDDVLLQVFTKQGK
jgi:hypothetical protein